MNKLALAGDASFIHKTPHLEVVELNYNRPISKEIGLNQKAV